MGNPTLRETFGITDADAQLVSDTAEKFVNDVFANAKKDKSGANALRFLAVNALLGASIRAMTIALCDATIDKEIGIARVAEQYDHAYKDVQSSVHAVSDKTVQ